MISVIVPVYNVEPYLQKCLDSVVGQTYQNMEILIIDDGSTDGSGKVCDEYKKDERVKVFHTKNRGLSAARNLGLDNATGDWIVFVDSDDWVDVDAFEIALSVAKYQKADLVFWGYVKEYEDHSIRKSFFWEDGFVFEREQVKYLLHRRLFGLLGKELAHPEYANSFDTAWGKLYKAEAIKNNHIRFEDTAVIGTEDALFNILFMGYVQKAVYVARCMNHYRKNNTSLTKLYKPNLMKQWQTLFSRMYDYIVSRRLPDVFEDALNNRIALSIIGLGLNAVNSTETVSQKRRYLSDVIHTEMYTKAIQSFSIKRLSFYWKIFFLFVKFRFVYGIYFSLLIMNKMI